MPRSCEQLEQATVDAERWLADLNPGDPAVHVERFSGATTRATTARPPGSTSLTGTGPQDD